MDLEKCVLTSKNGASCLRGTPGYCTDTKLSQTKRKNVMRRQTDSLKWTGISMPHPLFVSRHDACHGTMTEGLILMLTNVD